MLRFKYSVLAFCLAGARFYGAEPEPSPFNWCNAYEKTSIEPLFERITEAMEDEKLKDDPFDCFYERYSCFWKKAKLAPTKEIAYTYMKSLYACLQKDIATSNYHFNSASEEISISKNIYYQEFVTRCCGHEREETFFLHRSAVAWAERVRPEVLESIQQTPSTPRKYKCFKNLEEIRPASKAQHEMPASVDTDFIPRGRYKKENVNAWVAPPRSMFADIFTGNFGTPYVARVTWYHKDNDTTCDHSRLSAGSVELLITSVAYNIAPLKKAIATLYTLLEHMVRMESSIENRIASLETIIGYTFKNKAHIRTALTYGTEGFYLLEALGDAIIYEVTTKALLERVDISTVEALHNKREEYKTNAALAAAYRKLELGPCLTWVRDASSPNRGEEKVYAGAYEALVGAIEKDAGHPRATNFLRKTLLNILRIGGALSERAHPSAETKENTEDESREGCLWKKIAPHLRSLDLKQPCRALHGLLALGVIEHVRYDLKNKVLYINKKPFVRGHINKRVGIKELKESLASGFLLRVYKKGGANKCKEDDRFGSKGE